MPGSSGQPFICTEPLLRGASPHPGTSVGRHASALSVGHGLQNLDACKLLNATQTCPRARCYLPTKAARLGPEAGLPAAQRSGQLCYHLCCALRSRNALFQPSSWRVSCLNLRSAGLANYCTDLVGDCRNRPENGRCLCRSFQIHGSDEYLPSRNEYLQWSEIRHSACSLPPAQQTTAMGH